MVSEGPDHGVGVDPSLLKCAFSFQGMYHQDLRLSVLWSLRPGNRAAAATCGHGRCELPAILRVTQKSLAASDLFAAAEAKNPAISAAEWLRARLRHRGHCDSAMRFLCR